MLTTGQLGNQLGDDALSHRTVGDVGPHVVMQTGTQYQSAQQTPHRPFHDMLPHLHTKYKVVQILPGLFTLVYTQIQYRLYLNHLVQ